MLSAVQGSRIGADKEFARYLIEGDHPQRLQEPAVSALVFYFDAHGEWQHAGVLVAPNVVRSKWGELPVYKHGIDELPTRYGSSKRYYRIPLPEAALQLYLDYVEERRCGQVE